MNFDLADLRAFLAVADLGSFRAASEALHLSQSALSRRVDKLEAALGVQLMTRTTRKVELTTIGRGFVPRARSVLNELESALVGIRDVAERLSGMVTIACVPSAVAYFLPDVIREYHASYPRIRIRIIDESSSQVLTAVARGDADFGLTYIGANDAEIEFKPLLEEPFVAAVSRKHPLAKRKSVDWADLPTMQELGYKDFVITQFQGLLAPAGTDPRIIATLHDAVVQAVKDPEVVRKLATEGGNEIIAGTPEEFTRQLRDDLQRYRQLISEAHITAE